MERRKVISVISNITFGTSVIIAIYALTKIYIVRKSLPPGVCPVDNNSSYLYFAIFLAIVSLLFDFFSKKN